MSPEQIVNEYEKAKLEADFQNDQARKNTIRLDEATHTIQRLEKVRHIAKVKLDEAVKVRDLHQDTVDKLSARYVKAKQLIELKQQVEESKRNLEKCIEANDFWSNN